MADQRLVGLELAYDSVQNQITSESDVVVCSIHWHLIVNGYKCVGHGETKTDGEQKTEKLPGNWAENKDVYILRYKPNHAEEQFLLKIVRMVDSVFIHFMRCRDEKVSSLNVKISDYATENFATFDHAFKNSEKLCRLLTNEITRPFTSQSSTSVTPTQSQSRPQLPIDDDPLRIPPSRPRGDLTRHPGWNDPGDPFSVGRSDLDPLGRLGHGGGGMLMDPFRGPGGRMGPRYGIRPSFPRGVLPGARFDPIYPLGNNPEPNPDHLPPPGADDMFM